MLLLALIGVPSRGKLQGERSTHLSIGSSCTPNVGEKLFALGSPLLRLRPQAPLPWIQPRRPWSDRIGYNASRDPSGTLCEGVGHAWGETIRRGRRGCKAQDGETGRSCHQTRSEDQA